MGSEDDVLDDGDVVVPADLPLEAIAEEVQNSWHLKVRSLQIEADLLVSLVLFSVQRMCSVMPACAPLCVCVCVCVCVCAEKGMRRLLMPTCPPCIHRAVYT